MSRLQLCRDEYGPCVDSALDGTFNGAGGIGLTTRGRSWKRGRLTTATRRYRQRIVE